MEITIAKFNAITTGDMFVEYKQRDDDEHDEDEDEVMGIYRIELGNSFIKVGIQKNETGVMSAYLDSRYETHQHYVKLMCYVTFVIGQRINGGKVFKKLTFEKDSEKVTFDI